MFHTPRKRPGLHVHTTREQSGGVHWGFQVHFLRKKSHTYLDMETMVRGAPQLLHFGALETYILIDLAILSMVIKCFIKTSSVQVLKTTCFHGTRHVPTLYWRVVHCLRVSWFRLWLIDLWGLFLPFLPLQTMFWWMCASIFAHLRKRFYGIFPVELSARPVFPKYQTVSPTHAFPLGSTCLCEHIGSASRHAS